MNLRPSPINRDILCRTSGFGTAYGLLIASLMINLFENKLAGLGCVYLGQEV